MFKSLIAFGQFYRIYQISTSVGLYDRPQLTYACDRQRRLSRRLRNKRRSRRFTNEGSTTSVRPFGSIDDANSSCQVGPVGKERPLAQGVDAVHAAVYPESGKVHMK